MLILIIATLLPTLALGLVLLGGPGVAVGVLVWMVVFIPAIVAVGPALLEWLIG